jgi:hypothetical protein
MDESWRPIVSGLFGGLATMGLFFALRNQVPRSSEGCDVAVLTARYKWHIRFVDIAFVAALIGSVFVYQWDWAASNDWRPLALAFGGGAVVPFLMVYASLRADRDGSNFADFMTALAVHDGCPIWLLNGALAFCAGLLVMGIGGYVFGK